MNWGKMKKNNSEMGYKPMFFRLNNSAEKAHFLELLSTKNYINIYDQIEFQIKDLIKCKNPKIKFTIELLEEFYLNFVKDITLDNYGVWVYYPWSNSMVHILDEADFIEVRTNRNKHKITLEEQKKLAKQKVGVIGLSVGQSVSLTLAMERSFGELRIADFDVLDLSNLNRIRTGIHNLNIPKTVVVAREIAEIDPFLKITCFHEGVNENNLDSFLTEGGKLDVLIDECDSLDIKIKARLKARELGIPVLMDTSDRGMLAFERFDLESNRPIFHGLISDESLFYSVTTSEDFFELALKILDEDKISERMRLSIKEIGETILTWPQLAASVIAGGGITAEVYRKIVLNSGVSSGRYYIDFDVISGKSEV